MARQRQQPEQIVLRLVQQVEQTGANELSLAGLGLSSLPESVTRLTNLTTLNLSENKLSSLPGSVTRLTNLDALDLSHNELSSLPESVTRLTNLKELYLSGNNLSSLPESFGQLTRLTNLWLQGNRLTALPESIGRLTNLTELILHVNNLVAPPEAIERLTALNKLDLRDNELAGFPEVIGRLTSLTTLDLSNNHLTSVPEVIGGLTALTTLDLYGNRLSSLPEALGRLTNLTTLNLSGSRLSSLPESVTRLTSLTTLDLSNNHLTSVPEVIDGLTALTTLDLSHNELSSLPESFGRLTNLATLDLSRNKLSSLPESVTRLTNLKQLLLHDNDALGLPPEILGPRLHQVESGRPVADPKAILAYYFQQQRGNRRPLAEAKVLVVGQGSVGKTSLIKYWLTGQKCDGSEVKTTKIDISHPVEKLAVPYPDGGKTLDVALNVWDFGGQEIYHATHQFFLTKRSLYLLVLDARLTEDQNNLHYWFQVIRSFGGESPVLVVINKSEQHRLDLNTNRLRQDYGEQFVGVVRVSCQQPFGRDELTEAIRTQIGRLKDVFNELPEAYFVVKAELEKKAKRQNFLPYDDYEKLCKKKDLTATIDQTTLIRFLHDLGVVLNFNDAANPYKLNDTTILNPEWVTDGVYAMFNDHQLMHDRGVLTREHLDRILPDDTYPADKKDVIVEMMHRFELCFGFPEEKGARWLVPELLFKEEPVLDWNEAESLNFQYHYEVLPGGLICRFLVRMHRHVAQKTYWRSGVALDLDGHRTLVRGDTARGKVFITVQGSGDRRLALARVRHVFEDIHATIPGLKVAEKVPLPDRPEVVIGYAHLCSLEKIGEEFVVPEGVEDRYRVQDLLNGVSTPDERDRRRRKDEVNRPPPEPKKEEDKPDILERTTEKAKKVRVLIGVIGAIVAGVGVVIAKIRGWFSG